MTKTVAKILSPLFLSFIFLLGGYLALTKAMGGTLSALGLFLTDGTEAPAYQGEDIFQGYKGPRELEETIDADSIQFPKRGDLYARLAIESCGIEDDVYFDTSERALNRGLGQHYSSRIPGYGEPILIAGHNNRSFHRLGEAAVGDIVTITTNYGIYQYQITETKILRADDPTAYDLTLPREQLILYTCYPFTTLSLTPLRYFVYADKISGPVVLH